MRVGRTTGFQDFYRASPQEALALILIRIIMRQRGITTLELAKKLKITQAHLENYLRPSGPHDKSLDRIDVALTELTDLRGGVYKAAGSTADAIVELAREIQLSPGTRGAFYEQD